MKAAFVGAAVLATAAYAQITMDCGANLGKCPESKPCCSRTPLPSFRFSTWSVCGVTNIVYG